jgi:hypothetical protein
VPIMVSQTDPSPERIRHAIPNPSNTATPSQTHKYILLQNYWPIKRLLPNSFCDTSRENFVVDAKGNRVGVFLPIKARMGSGFSVSIPNAGRKQITLNPFHIKRKRARLDCQYCLIRNRRWLSFITMYAIPLPVSMWAMPSVVFTLHLKN